MNPDQPFLSPDQQAAFDRLDASAAVLDEHGVVRAVNAAWRDFADSGNLADPAYGLGSRYDRWNGVDPFAQRVGAGLEGLLSGGLSSFSVVYPCHSPEERRWYRMVAARAVHDERARVLVVHRRLEDASEDHEMRETTSSVAQDLFATEMICAWCDPAAGEVDEERAVNISHGICGDCFEEVGSGG
ncbi:MAG: PAS domain-containing protein [Acidimicrobiales bacterium]